MKNNKMQDLELCSIVGYEHIKIYQPKGFFKMTSDSLALANFVKVNYKDKNIMDIGTGLACIPLVLSVKSNAHITAVEIDKSVADIAMKSVKFNHLEKQITIVNEDINDYAKRSHINSYDIIVSNPPYFSFENGYLNSSEVLSKARHDITLELDSIFSISSKLLKDGGKLVLVFTATRLIEIIDLYHKYHFTIKRLQFIHGGIGKGAKTFLIEGSKNGKEGMVVSFPLILNMEGDFFV